jgi:hypothetical protein
MGQQLWAAGSRGRVLRLFSSLSFPFLPLLLFRLITAFGANLTLCSSVRLFGVPAVNSLA